MLNKNIKILIIILAVVMSIVILLSIFTKIQNKRISHLRKTLDSLESGKLDQLDKKYFKPGEYPETDSGVKNPGN